MSRLPSLQVTPTNLQLKIVLIVEDYGSKGIIRKNKGRTRDSPAFPRSIIVRLLLAILVPPITPEA
jgi:hypothetical protein